jgi:CheY-like chemotaxis protein
VGEPEGPETRELLARARAVLISDSLDGAHDLLRRLRLADATWTLPSLLCASEPTRESVLQALAEGASHVLRLPIDPAELERVLDLADPRGSG